MKEIRVTCRAADILPIDSLIEFQGNLKSISKDNLEKLKRSILRHGFTAPFFIWHGVDYHIIDGHQRLKALCSLREEGYDMPLLPVVYIDADNEAEAKEKLLYITSQYGEFSTEGVYEFMDGLEINWENLRLSAGEFQFDPMFNQEETIGDDEAPEVQEEVYSQLGEIYQLGEHRLMCGDSTSIDAVEKLMDGAKADMVFTDPPYGIDFAPQRGTHGKILNDALDGAEFDNFLDDVFGAALAFMKPDTYAFVWTGWSKIGAFERSLQKFFKIQAMHIWVKNNFGIGYYSRPKHEPFYLCLNGKPVYPSKAPADVWEAKKVHKTVHSCEKPVDLITDILDTYHKNSLVIDFFGGSGSTLIACAKTNRQCRMMELDPIYCDVIRRRWTKWATENGKEVGSGRLEPSKTANG